MKTQNEDIWKAIYSTYKKGICLSERNLQAIMFSELQKIHENTVIVEPSWWIDSKTYRPDIVVIRDNSIVQIFELKFSVVVKLQDSVTKKWVDDIEKLKVYFQNRTKTTNGTHYFIQLDPEKGKYNNICSNNINNECEYNIAIITNGIDEKTICSSIKKKINFSEPKINLWYMSITEKKHDYRIIEDILNNMEQ